MILRIALALILLVLPASARAAELPDLIGTVVELEGAAQKTAIDLNSPTGATITTPVSVGAPVHLNDEIATGPESKLLILFIDDTQVTLGENSSIAVDEYVFDPAENREAYGHYKAYKGAFLWVSGWMNKAQKNDISIETPHGAIGIRGTTVWGGRLGDDYGVFVQDGAVSVQNNTGSVLVRAGEGVDLRSRDVRPSEIKTWGDEKIARAVATVTFSDIPRVSQLVAAQKQANLQLRRNHADALAARREQRRQLIEKKRDENREILEEKIEQRREKLPDTQMPAKIIEPLPAPEIEKPEDPAEDALEQKRSRREQRQQEWIKNRKD